MIFASIQLLLLWLPNADFLIPSLLSFNTLFFSENKSFLYED